jgi:hypothetical protein
MYGMSEVKVTSGEGSIALRGASDTGYTNRKWQLQILPRINDRPLALVHFYASWHA